MEHPAALVEGDGTYRWHAGAPDDDASQRAFGELVGRIDERLAEHDLDALGSCPWRRPRTRHPSLEGEPESGAGLRAGAT